jgi:hypothetical protein
MRWARNVAHMGEITNMYRVLARTHKDLGMDVRIILKWISKK